MAPPEVNGEVERSWLKFWLTPLGVFVVAVSIAFGAQVYNSLRFQEEISERRLAFCENENDDARQTRKFWEGVIGLNTRNRDVILIMEGRRIPAELVNATSPEDLARFRRLLEEIYPITDCDEF